MTCHPKKTKALTAAPLTLGHETVAPMAAARGLMGATMVAGPMAGLVMRGKMAMQANLLTAASQAMEALLVIVAQETAAKAASLNLAMAALTRTVNAVMQAALAARGATEASKTMLISR